MIFAFDHEHKPGDVCSIATCEAARRAPVLCGDEVHGDIPQRIIRTATAVEYLHQPVPDGWVIPPLEYGCDFIYEVECLPTPDASKPAVAEEPREGLPGGSK